MKWEDICFPLLNISSEFHDYLISSKAKVFFDVCIMSPTVSRINLVSVLSVSIFKTCIIQREYKYKELQVQSLIFNKRIVREIWKLFDFEHGVGISQEMSRMENEIENFNFSLRILKRRFKGTLGSKRSVLVWYTTMNCMQWNFFQIMWVFLVFSFSGNSLHEWTLFLSRLNQYLQLIITS